MFPMFRILNGFLIGSVMVKENLLLSNRKVVQNYEWLS